MLTSVIIPCYNAEQFVGDAIQSALSQSYPEVEVVVIDDGSTDGSLQVIRSFGDRVTWESGPNRGGCSARNRGLELAQGELIQFLDADDLLKPEKLKRQVALASEHPDAITYCDYEAREYETGELLAIHSRESQGRDTVEFVLMNQRLTISAPLHWRRHLLEIGGFREGLACAQEYDLHLRLACAGRSFIHIPEVLHVVRQCKGSVSSNSIRVLDQHELICLNAYRSLDYNGQLNEHRAACLAGLLASDGRAYTRFELHDRATRYFRLAAMLHPKGGLDRAYSPPVRWLRSVLGIRLAERMAGLKRQVFKQAENRW